MKNLQLALALFAAVLTGCAGNPDKKLTQDISRITPAEPPAFLNAEVADLFGKANFSARVEVQKGIPGSRPPLLGELYGRDGNLFFVSDEQRAKGSLSTGLSALYDSKTRTAYLLNEPLQGYAPIRDSGTNAPLNVVAVGEENIGSERCRKSILNRQVANEVVPVLVVWRGIAQQDFPLRIEMTNTPGAVTLNLTRVRFQAPPPETFALPNGFKRYESTDAMLSELVRRRTDLLTGRNARKRDRYGNPAAVEEDFGPANEPPRRNY
jgi:hypothetical protein